MFKVTGRFDGESHSLTWADGVVTASLDRLQRLFDTYVDDDGPVGPYNGEQTFGKSAHLQSPWSSRVLMEQCLDEVEAITGDVPTVENEPGRVY